VLDDIGCELRGEMDDLQEVLGESSASKGNRKAFGSDGCLRGWFEEDSVACDQCWEDGVDGREIGKAGRIKVISNG
jgi:hypothetical protein